MTDRSDIELLREYARTGVEAAFTEVVTRHLGLVYYAALRQTGVPEVAEEVAQTVFTLLARKAGSLPVGTIIPGWLFKTTRFVGARAARGDHRRRRREEEAVRMNLNSGSEQSDPMEQAVPILDEMLARLRQADREALLVRYFDGKSFAELGRALGASEETARKRVQRALERLRQLLASRGVALGTGTLASGLQATGLHAAPAGLAAVVSGAAIQQAAGATTLTLLTQTTLKAMTLTKLKILGTAAVAFALAGGTVAYVSRSQPESLPPLVKREEGTRERTQDEVARLEAENSRLSNALAQTTSDNQRLEAAKQEAEQSADKYRELADKVKAENPTPLESYPTPRHALVGFGKLALLTRSTKEFAKLPPEERTGAQPEKVKADMMQRMQEAVRLVQAMSELKMDQSWQEKARTPEEDADQFTCFLHGMLDLNEQQFTQIETALKNHYQIPGVERAVIPVAGPGAGKMPRSPFQSLDQNTLQQIQSQLTQAQRETLEQVMTPQK
jgi:RNA polymerase sigma factor (sigma-70 family)